MGRYSGGYTIIEVMIVLAITGILFVSAVLTFHGEQGRTGFSQAMQDLSSQIQNYASQISSGTYPGSSGYSCDATGGDPTLSVATSPPAPAPGAQCIFLGEALVADPGSSSIEAYTVVGTRDQFNGNIDTGQPATSIDEETNPEVAQYPRNTVVMNQNYSLENGATIKSSTGPSAGNYEMVGIYNNLQANASSGTTATSNLLLEFYSCNHGGSPPCSPNQPNNIIKCINNWSPPRACGPNPSTGSAPLGSQWVLCIEGGDGETAQLEVDSSSTGTSDLTVKTNFVSC